MCDERWNDTVVLVKGASEQEHLNVRFSQIDML